MKKRILFVIESLIAAGGEKSLVTLLSLIDYDKYDVDLQLFGFGGEFEQYVPQNVSVLPPLSYPAFLMHQRSGTFKMWCSRFCYSLSIRGSKKTIKEKARLYWTHISSCIEENPAHYDVAIAYGQCHPTFYVAEKVNADKKLAWVNCIYHLDGKEREWQRPFYEVMDKIVMVSEAALTHFKGVYPDMAQKMDLMPDLVVPDFISRMADNGKSFDDGNKGIKLLTVARLNKADKGYDITLDACRILKKRGVDFKWYALGRGEYKSEMERYIEEHGLKDTFILLGVTPNPYPYIKACDIYVQPSRYEGKSVTVREAQMLCKPVVVTNYPTASSQIIDSVDGKIVPMDNEECAQGLAEFILNTELQKQITEYLKTHDYGNVGEVEKLYKLL